MKVVHVVPALFGADGVVGGGERYALELARHMALRGATTLIAFGGRDRHERIGPLDVRVIGNPWHVRGQQQNPFAFRLLPAIAGADVVHCHQQHILMSSAAAAWRRCHGKSVFVSELGGGGWDVSAYLSTDAWVHGHLHLSEYSRRVYGHDHLDRARVVGGGVDTDKFSPEPGVLRDGTVLFVGRVLPHKGIDDLIRGLPSGMSLAVVGPQPDQKYAASLAALAAGKNVTFKTGLTDTELIGEYRRALCVVLPSVYRTGAGTNTSVPELLGQTLLEGMACATPAVCTAVASLPEIVDDGCSGYVVQPNMPEAIGHRLTELRDRPEQALAMGRAARARVLQHFTWNAVVERCLDAYETLGKRLS
jgi:glycosyltransferase involved in cell wall biosynthesis